RQHRPAKRQGQHRDSAPAGRHACRRAAPRARAAARRPPRPQTPTTCTHSGGHPMNGLESGKRRLHPLASAARQGVVSRLRAAARLADEDLEANAAVLRELVDEALDQAEAFAVAAGSPAPASAGGAAQAVAGETTRAATA